jgi:hypothetical protein
MLNLGDQNTKFFFNAVKSKKTDSKIKEMPLISLTHSSFRSIHLQLSIEWPLVPKTMELGWDRFVEIFTYHFRPNFDKKKKKKVSTIEPSYKTKISDLYGKQSSKILYVREYIYS